MFKDRIGENIRSVLFNIPSADTWSSAVDLYQGQNMIYVS